MWEFPSLFQIPLAEWIDKGMAWILQNWSAFFDGISDGMLYVLLNIEHFLLWVPWIAVVVFVALSAWWALRRWWAGLLFAGFLMIIGALGHWDMAMMTLAIIIAAVVLSLVIGIPTGIIMTRSKFVDSITKPILDAMQTMPSFVYLIPAMMLFGLGKVPAVIATVIYAVPPVIRLTTIGIQQVSPRVVEGAKAFGANTRQILFDVQLPLAIPSIMVGINQTTMMALAMVVIASMIGARGLGMEVLLAIQRVEVGRGVEAGLSIVLLAIIIDRITHAMGTKNDYRTRA